jgi:MFS transporter, PAT family, beta-lactamase induction signal transducer AmpG
MHKSVLKAFANPTLLVMFFLGLSCGFPLALTASTLKTWLASLDISIKEIAAFAWIAIPYSTKFIWSPFVDGLKIPYLHKLLGQRRSWLLVTQISLIGAVFLLGSSNPAKSLFCCAAAATLVAFLSATQDILVDAYRIEKLPKETQAMGVTMYVYGYRLGLYVSGVGLLLLADQLTWPIAYYIGAFILVIGVISTLSCTEPKYKHKKILENSSYLERFIHMVINPFKEFITIDKWYYIIIFIVLFKLGDALAGNLTNVFLIKLGFTLQELALYVKTYGLIATFLGLFLGGIIVQRYGIFKSLLFAGVIQLLSNLMFIYQDYMGHDTLTLIFTISIENISGAIGDVVFVAYLSSLCNFQFAATQYALLSSLATVARNMISGSSGFLVDSYGWTIFFIISIIAALPGILMIFKIRTIKRKQE